MFKRVLKIRSTAEQVADFLCEAIQSGQLQGQMPGVHALAKELGIHHTTAAEALGQLETKGFLKSAGPGKKREILIPDEAEGLRLKVGILLYEPQDIGTQPVNELRHQLSRAGLEPVVADTSLVELKFDVKRLESVVNACRADAWVVLAGSREVLQWFDEHGVPTFALFGNGKETGVAHTGPIKSPQMREIVQGLIHLGHSRMVLLIAEHLRLDHPVPLVDVYLDELERQGMPPGAYHLPEWSRKQGSLQACLKALFQVTPPTVLIVDDPLMLPAILQFLNQRKLSVPEDISLLCLDGDPSFQWMEPTIARLETDIEVSVCHAVRWATRVAKGKVGRRKFFTKAKFIEGATVGPARS